MVGTHTQPVPADIIDGFTLAEASLAVGLCATLAIGLTPVLLRAARAAGSARDRSVATTAAIERIEQLRALDWGQAIDAAGADIEVSDRTTQLDEVPATSGGPGLGAAPAASLLRDIDGWVDYLDADGRWIGNARTRPAAARFVRRWHVAPLPSAPDQALSLQVLVTPFPVEQQMGLRTDLRPRPGDVWLVSVRVREHYR